MDMNLLHHKQQYYIDCIERLVGGGIARLSWGNIREAIDFLTENVMFNLERLTNLSCFARGRVLDSANRFDSVTSLGYPPQDKCSSYGRCNVPGDPVLYAGVGTELVFSEIGAKVGDIIGLLHMTPTKDLLCARVGALDLWRRTSGMCLMSDDIKQKIKERHRNPEHITDFLLDSFISDYFSRAGDNITYKLTSAYSAVTMNSPDIFGLIYDSVDHTAGACLALKPIAFDNFLQPKVVQIVKITSYLGYGIYDFEEIDRASKFDGKKILWE